MLKQPVQEFNNCLIPVSCNSWPSIIHPPITMWLVVLMVDDGSKDCSMDGVISLFESMFDPVECLLTARKLLSDPCTSDVQTIHINALDLDGLQLALASQCDLTVIQCGDLVQAHCSNVGLE